MNGPQVSHHAAERFLQRIDSNEPYPRSAIRRAVEKGRPVDLAHIAGRTVVDTAKGAVYVMKGNTVATVLRGDIDRGGA